MARTDTISINRNLLQRLQHNPDYNYGRELTGHRISEEGETAVEEQPMDTDVLEGLPQWAWITILVVLALVLLYVLYRTGTLRRMWDFVTQWKLLRKNDGGEDEDEDDDNKEDEEEAEEGASSEDTDIHSLKPEDITDGAETAMAAGDYRRAVRLIYLTTLRTLSEQNVVKWQAHKTPEDYAREANLVAFTRLTMRFMMVRYGDYDATLALCEQLLVLQQETIPAPRAPRKEVPHE